jgi:cellulose biosynthesis protein BcsQ
MVMVDVQIQRNGSRVPVVAFFGTKGGVGKTTIARRFAELVTLAKGSPNVLLIDGDVHHRGMTVDMTTNTPTACKTVHDYVVTQNWDQVEAVNCTGEIRGAGEHSGRLWFIPASEPNAPDVFAASASIGAAKLLETLHQVASRAVAKYECGCVVVDCGPIIDPYTAASAMLADRAFIIGQNEPISFSSLDTYPQKLREFYEDFRMGKMKVIINKVRGWQRLEDRRLSRDVFHAIPFTMEIVDLSEGLITAGQMQTMIFEDHIAQIVEKVFKADHQELVPERKDLLPDDWKKLAERAQGVERSPAISRLGLARLLLPLGLLGAVGGGLEYRLTSAAREQAEVSAYKSALLETIKRETMTLESRGVKPSAKLTAALVASEAIKPGDVRSIEVAVQATRDGGVGALPTRQSLDRSRENIGVGVLLGSVLLALLGFLAGRSRQQYLAALRGLRKNGVDWMLKEMNSKQSARRTFDKLLRMADAQGAE